MEAHQWKYVAEGGMHALFAHHPSFQTGNDGTNNKNASSLCPWNGHLLRIKKSDLCFSRVILSIINLQNMNDGKIKMHKSDVRSKDNDEESSDHHQTSFIKNVLFPLLYPYIDIPSIVQLEWDFLNMLYETTLSSGLIPEARRRDWMNYPNTNEDRKHQKNSVPKPCGLLLIDYKKTILPTTISTQTMLQLSVEIKPKAGYKAFSPFVNIEHKIKFEQCRFQLLQRLQLEGHIQKGWVSANNNSATTTFRVSEYNPLDLFSNNLKQITNAISSLLECPQNNLKVWMNDILVIGMMDSSSLSLSSKMDDNKSQSTEHSSILKLLPDLLAHILQEESDVLRKLLDLQLLDILDADGACIIYERLVQLCDNDNEKAENLIDAYTTKQENQEFPHLLLKNSPFQPPQKLSQLILLCDQIEEFRQHLLAQYNAKQSEPFTTADHSVYRNKCLQIVDNLSIEECCYLLQNWLLSLTCCDVSMFVSIAKVDPKECATISSLLVDDYNIIIPEAASGTNDNNNWDKMDNQIIRLTAVKRLDDEVGFAVFKGHDNNDLSVYAYNIKLIDLENKPAEKLRHRHKKEQVFSMSV